MPHDNPGHTTRSSSPALNWALGVLFTFALAWIGMTLAKQPGFSRFGAMICAILLAVVFRQLIGYPQRLRPGIQFSSRTLLRAAIVLFGFRLNLAIVLNEGLGLLLRDVGSVVGAVAITLLVAKWLKADSDMALMVGVGTGVCGAAAIAAVSPIIGAKEEDTALSVGIIALTGTLFTVVYTLLRPILPLSATQYGIWSGVSLHEIAHVVAAASPAGADALAIALLAKLGRVLLLIPLCFTLVWWLKTRGKQGQAKVDFPWFLLGFIATSIIGSYLHVPKAWMTTFTTLSSFLLTAAMVGLGLNINLKAIGGKALRPWLAMLAASVILAVVTYLTII